MRSLQLCIVSKIALCLNLHPTEFYRMCNERRTAGIPGRAVIRTGRRRPPWRWSLTCELEQRQRLVVRQHGKVGAGAAGVPVPAPASATARQAGSPLTK